MEGNKKHPWLPLAITLVIVTGWCYCVTQVSGCAKEIRSTDPIDFTKRR